MFWKMRSSSFRLPKLVLSATGGGAAGAPVLKALATLRTRGRECRTKQGHVNSCATLVEPGADELPHSASSSPPRHVLQHTAKLGAAMQGRSQGRAGQHGCDGGRVRPSRSGSTTSTDDRGCCAGCYAAQSCPPSMQPALVWGGASMLWSRLRPGFATCLDRTRCTLNRHTTAHRRHLCQVAGSSPTRTSEPHPAGPLLAHPRTCCGCN